MFLRGSKIIVLMFLYVKIDYCVIIGYYLRIDYWIWTSLTFLKMGLMKQIQPDSDQNIWGCTIIGFFLGAALLSLFSVWQKFLLGASITAIEGYIVPVIFGGGVGLVMGRYYCKLRVSTEKVKTNEYRYRTLFDNASDAIFINTIDDVIIDANRKACELLGYSRDELLQMKVSDLRLTKSGNLSSGIILSELEHGKPFEIMNKHRDGTEVPVEVATSKFFDSETDLALSIVRDIRERREASELQQAVYQVSEAVHSTKTLENLFEVIHKILGSLLRVNNFLIALINPQTDTVEFSYFYSELGERPPVDAGRGLTRYVLTTEKPLLATPEIFKDLQDRGEIELVGMPTLDWLGVPLKIQDETIGVLAVQSYDDSIRLTDKHQEILVFASTQVAMAIERKRAEEQLYRHNQELTVLNRVIAGASTQSDPQVVMETACRELSRIHRVACTAIYLLNSQKTAATLSAYWAQNALIPFEDIEIQVDHNSIFQHILNKKNILLAFNASKDPRLADLHEQFKLQGVESALAVPLLLNDEEVIGCLLLLDTWPHRFSADEMNLIWRITDQVTAAVARMQLEEERRLLSAAVTNTAESVIITDPQQRIIYVNSAFEEKSGFTREEVLDRTPLDFISSDQNGRNNDDLCREVFQTLREGEAWHGRIINQRKDGDQYTDDVIISPIYDDQNQLANYISVQRDITRELELEKQYHHAQKMESIGRLTGSIAHDFNNLLTAINGFAELLQMRLPSNTPLQDMASSILRSGKRATELISQLMAFSRQQAIELQVVNLNSIVSGIDGMLRRIIGEETQLQTMLASGLWSIKADPGQIEQIIVNLVVNARDAMPDGGYVTLRTNNTRLDEEYTETHLGTLPGDYVLLMVSDTGVGMNETVKSHIFEPFFTTKAKGKGTGLGLATVYGIVQQNGGHIWVESTEGIGTVIKVYLPRSVKENTLTSTQDENNYQLGRVTGSETILLVEDNEDVRSFSRRTLKQQGYNILEARNGLEALRLSRNYEGIINLILTDVVMPVMNGKVLVDKIRKERADIKVLFMSGYPNEQIAEHDIHKPGVAFLQKPFSPRLLIHQVRQAIDSE